MPLELLIISAAIVSGLACSGITAIHFRRRRLNLYNRGWNAGREFAIRNLHDTVSR